jgi:hypothetical protein
MYTKGKHLRLSTSATEGCIEYAFGGYNSLAALMQRSLAVGDLSLLKRGTGSLEGLVMVDVVVS